MQDSDGCGFFYLNKERSSNVKGCNGTGWKVCILKKMKRKWKKKTREGTKCARINNEQGTMMVR